MCQPDQDQYDNGWNWIMDILAGEPEGWWRESIAKIKWKTMHQALPNAWRHHVDGAIAALELYFSTGSTERITRT